MSQPGPNPRHPVFKSRPFQHTAQSVAPTSWEHNRLRQEEVTNSSPRFWQCPASGWWGGGGRGVGVGAAARWWLKQTTQGPQVTSPRSGTKCQRNEKSLRGDRTGSLEEKEGTVTWPLREQAGQRGPVSRVRQQAMIRPQENKRSWLQLSSLRTSPHDSLSLPSHCLLL